MIPDLTAAALLYPQLGPATNTVWAGNLAFAGLGIYALGGPIVHWAHGRVGTGFGSLALRVVVPFVSLIAFVGACWNRCEDSEAIAIGAAIMLPGVLAPPIIDYLRAYEEPRSPHASRAQPIRFAPVLGSVQDSQRRFVPTLSIAIGGL
jgi:hypothetical protein